MGVDPTVVDKGLCDVFEGLRSSNKRLNVDINRKD